MENNRQTYTDCVLSWHESGCPHYPKEIQKHVMTPTYENDFVHCKYEILMNVIR